MMGKAKAQEDAKKARVEKRGNGSIGKVALSSVGKGEAWKHVDVLNEVYRYLNPYEVSTCRSVCSLWNKESMRKLRLNPESYGKLSVYRRKHGGLARVNALYKFLSKMSQEERERSLFGSMEFKFMNHIFINGKIPAGEAHIPIFQDFGWIIQHLQIFVNKISDLFILFEYCRNLKTLALSVQTHMLTGKSVRTRSGKYEIQKFGIVDQTDYADWNINEKVIMDQLHSLCMSYDAQWNFGDLFNERMPNLTTLKCKDLSATSEAVARRDVDGPARDPYHFVKELTKMRTSQLKSIIYVADDKRCLITNELLSLNLCSLTSFNLPCFVDGQTSLVACEWMELVKKVAKTLESLIFPATGKYVFKTEDEFPYLPKLAMADIPHTMAKTADFFQKMPNLKNLTLRYKFYDNLNLLEINYCNQNGVWYEFNGGFTSLNRGLRMWSVGEHRPPLQNLETMNMEMGHLTKVPDTLAQLFPNLRVLELVLLSPCAFNHVLDVIRIMKYEPTLTELSINQTVESSVENTCNSIMELPFGYRQSCDANMSLALMLVGVPSFLFNSVMLTGVQHVEGEFYQRMFMLSSLREMTHLRKFTLRHTECRRREMNQISELIVRECFSYMPNLTGKVISGGRNFF